MPGILLRSGETRVNKSTLSPSMWRLKPQRGKDESMHNKMTIFYGLNNYEMRLAVKKRMMKVLSSYLQSNTIQE